MNQNRKVAEYDVMYSSSIDTFIRYVNKKIEKGFIPIGGISVNIDENNREFYYQAMVKYEEN